MTIRWKQGDHAGMPYITEETKVIKDITKWKDDFIKQDLKYPDADWKVAQEACAKIDRKEKLATGLMVTGLFEASHFLMGFEDTLMNFLMEEESMHELLDALLEWKMDYAKELMDHLDLDAILFHDDLGAKDRLFFSEEVFTEFFKPRYEKLFGYITSRGVQVVLHADSYCEPLVEHFVDMHITTWQGALVTNDFKAMQERVEGRLMHGRYRLLCGQGRLERRGSARGGQKGHRGVCAIWSFYPLYHIRASGIDLPRCL